jgi:hypothetical protein
LINDIIASLPISREILLQKIRKKEQFQDKKENKNFYQNNDPELFTYGHTPETLVIKPENPHR